MKIRIAIVIIILTSTIVSLILTVRDRSRIEMLNTKIETQATYISNLESIAFTERVYTFPKELCECNQKRYNDAKLRATKLKATKLIESQVRDGLYEKN